MGMVISSNLKMERNDNHDDDHDDLGVYTPSCESPRLFWIYGSIHTRLLEEAMSYASRLCNDLTHCISDGNTLEEDREHYCEKCFCLLTPSMGGLLRYENEEVMIFDNIRVCDYAIIPWTYDTLLHSTEYRMDWNILNSKRSFVLPKAIIWISRTSPYSTSYGECKEFDKFLSQVLTSHGSVYNLDDDLEKRMFINQDEV